MDFEKLKDIARRLGGILVMDGNTPEFVIMPYATYAHEPAAPEDKEEAMIENLNKEIEALKEEIRQKETAELA